MYVPVRIVLRKQKMAYKAKVTFSSLINSLQTFVVQFSERY